MITFVLSVHRLSRRAAYCAFGCIAIAVTTTTASAQVVFSAAGADAAAINSTVTDFRTALGTLNPNVTGSAVGGRREINWDGVPDGFASPNALPQNFFNSNSPRGVVFSTPGTGFQVSANASSGQPINFGNVNPSYPAMFAPFSAQRLFTAIGSNILDVLFFVPGSTTVARTSAFGAVFSDVDLANTTSLQFFDQFNNSLGTYFASSFTGNQTFSFLGVQFAGSPSIARVRITAGNVALSASNTGDAVAMDDFIYGEPVAAVAVVPEPATLVLFGAGLAFLAVFARRRQAQRDHRDI